MCRRQKRVVTPVLWPQNWHWITGRGVRERGVRGSRLFITKAEVHSVKAYPPTSNEVLLPSHCVLSYIYHYRSMHRAPLLAKGTSHPPVHFKASNFLCMRLPFSVNSLIPPFPCCTVRCTFEGFLRPVNNFHGPNTVSSKQTVPLKFSLLGNYGTDIIASTSLNRVSCNSIGSGDTDEDAIAEDYDSRSLVYDSGDDQYTYHLQVKNYVMKGYCYIFELKLSVCPDPRLLELIVK